LNYLDDLNSVDTHQDIIVKPADMGGYYANILQYYSYVDIHANIPSSDADYTFEFTDDSGNTWSADSEGNEWYYYADGSHTYFFNGTEQTYYWWNSSGILMYIEESTGVWWGIDDDSSEQCFMTALDYYIKCWDADLTLEIYTDDEEAPYKYYNSFGTLWYFDDDENLVAKDSDGGIYICYIDGSTSYYGTDGSILYNGPEG
jgi:hypothetical protein